MLGGLVAIGLSYAAYALINRWLIQASFFSREQALAIVGFGTLIGLLGSATSVGGTCGEYEAGKREGGRGKGTAGARYVLARCYPSLFPLPPSRPTPPTPRAAAPRQPAPPRGHPPRALRGGAGARAAAHPGALTRRRAVQHRAPEARRPTGSSTSWTARSAASRRKSTTSPWTWCSPRTRWRRSARCSSGGSWTSTSAARCTPTRSLLAAESFGDLLSRYKYLYLVSRQDRLLANDMFKLRDRIARERTGSASTRATPWRGASRSAPRSCSATQRSSASGRRACARRGAARRAAERRLSELERNERALNDRDRRARARAPRSRSRGVPPRAAARSRPADLGRLDWPVAGTHRVSVRHGDGPQQHAHPLARHRHRGAGRHAREGRRDRHREPRRPARHVPHVGADRPRRWLLLVLRLSCGRGGRQGRPGARRAR